MEEDAQMAPEPIPASDESHPINVALERELKRALRGEEGVKWHRLLWCVAVPKRSAGQGYDAQGA